MQLSSQDRTQLNPPIPRLANKRRPYCGTTNHKRRLVTQKGHRHPLNAHDLGLVLVQAPQSFLKAHRYFSLSVFSPLWSIPLLSETLLILFPFINSLSHRFPQTRYPISLHKLLRLGRVFGDHTWQLFLANRLLPWSLRAWLVICKPQILSFCRRCLAEPNPTGRLPKPNNATFLSLRNNFSVA